MENEFQNMIPKLLAEVEELKKKLDEVTRKEESESMEEDVVVNDDTEVTWQAVLPQTKVPPSLPSSCMLCSLLHDPPPLEMVRNGSINPFSMGGLPEKSQSIIGGEREG